MMQEERRANRDLLPRTTSYALPMIRLDSALPNGTVARTLGKQLPRSDTSAGAKYRAAHRGRSKAELVAETTAPAHAIANKRPSRDKVVITLRRDDELGTD
jgi:hypothetical protein